MNSNLLSILVSQRKVRYFIPLLCFGRYRDTRNTARSHYKQVFQPRLRTVNDERCRDLIFGREIIDVCLVRHGEGHRHRGHQSRNVFVRDGNEVFVFFDHHDFAFQFVTLFVTATGAQRDGQEHTDKRGYESGSVHFVMGWSWAS